MVEGRGQEVARRCLRAAQEVEDLASRLRRLPPDSWVGPTAVAAGEAVLASSRRLVAAADALRRAAGDAGRLGRP